MYNDEPIPRELEHYMRQARKMRSAYLASLLRMAFARLARRPRLAARPRAMREAAAEGES